MKNTLKTMLKEYGYQYRETPFKLKSGIESNHYVDCRPVLMHPEGGEMAARLIRAIIHLHFPSVDAVAGVVLGGVPLVDEVASQEYAETDNFWYKAYVRPEPKEHGIKKLVEMDFGLTNRLAQHKLSNAYDQPRVVVLEDVWTTGGSAVRATEALAEIGLDPVGTIALVDREEEGSIRPQFALFKLSELMVIPRSRAADTSPNTPAQSQP